MNLKHLTDAALLADTRHLIARERELLTKVLHHLKEIDRRKLFSERGFSSLFDYCVRDLGYSEGSAQRRIQACRLLADIPEIEEKIESGSLTLANLAQASHFFKQNDIEAPSDKMAVLDQLENLSKNEAEKMLHVISGNDKPTDKETKRRTSGDTVRLTLNVPDSTIEKCDRLKGLIAKNYTYVELIEYMLDICIQNVEKKKFKSLSLPKVSPPPVKVNRVISSSVKGEVYRRDRKCTKCGTTKNLQFDHQMPFALGGSSDASNIRLLCFNCNQRARIRAKL